MSTAEIDRQPKLLRKTKSLCPECLKALDAEVFVDSDGLVKIRRICEKHGYFDETYTFSDPDLYAWAERYDYEGEGIDNPRTQVLSGCPLDCGLCPNHKSHTVLAIIDVTNRCNLRCPICFANAAVAGYVYEPSAEQIRSIMVNLRSNKPIPPPALQLSGGEPTVRDDLPELIRMASDVGFRHIEVNTNGIRFANDPDFFKSCVDAGMDTVYLQFDGLTDEIYEKSRGIALMDLKLRMIENARRHQFQSVVLVVTLVRGVNDKEVGRIIRFALDNSDVIRCVNVQPVSITGRIDTNSRRAMRINTSDFMKLVEEQMAGLIMTQDFRPVPSVVPVSRAVANLKGKRYVEFTTTPWCGVASFLFRTGGGKWIPITRLANVDRFFKALEAVSKDVKNGHKIRASFRLLTATRHMKARVLKDIFWPVLKEGSYERLGGFMRRIVMIGCMHFMDPYNFDLQRVEKCVIHYGLPDGTIRPFCTFNTLHRANVEKRFSVPYAEWQRNRKPNSSEEPLADHQKMK